MSSLETSDSPAATPIQIEAPAVPSVELAQPEPTPSSIDAPDSMPLPDSTLETEQSAEPESTLPETPGPDSTFEVEQPTELERPSTPTPDAALPIDSETATSAGTDEPSAIPQEQAANAEVTSPTEDLDAAAAGNPMQNPEAQAEPATEDHGETPLGDHVEEAAAAAETDGSNPEADSDESAQPDPESPGRRESPLGKASEHPDRTLSPAEHEARKQAGLARSRELIGKQNWANSKYAGETYYDALPQELQDKFPDGVDFSYEGFPIFDQYATHTVEFEGGFGASRDDDFSKANKEAGFADTPADSTWHHKEDGKTLLLVDAQLHGAVRHWGGVKITKLLSQDNPEA